ncbi:MAG: hypothetical protein V3W37_02915 [Candidatus Binatia bacterium]
MALQGAIGGIEAPHILYTLWGSTTDWTTVPVPAIMRWRWRESVDRLTRLDGWEISANGRFRLNMDFVYPYLVRADELKFQEIAQATQVVLYPHQDCSQSYEVLVEGPWTRRWAADHAVGHMNTIRFVEVRLRRQVHDVGEVLGAPGGMGQEIGTIIPVGGAPAGTSYGRYL